MRRHHWDFTVMNRREHLAAGLGSLLLALTPDAIAQEGSVIRMGGGEFENDPRFEYATTLVKSALALSMPGYSVHVRAGMNQPRLAVALRTRRIDVAALPSLHFDHVRLHHVPLPIRRGLLGVRLLLAREDDVARIAAVSSISALKKLKMGFGETWSETQQLRDLGFNIVGSADYTSMFELLRSGRVDYLSRSVAEVWEEVQNDKLAGGLAVVPGVAMFYPIDDYLAVSGSNTQMIRALETGVDQLLRNGEFWKVFNRFYRSVLTKTDISNRRILNVIGFGVDPRTQLDLFDILDLRVVEGEFRLPDGSNPGLGKLMKFSAERQLAPSYRAAQSANRVC
jgi:hypothetical protein